MKKIIFTFFFSALVFGAFAQSWNVSGNAGTTSSNYVGTSDCKPLIFRTNGVERMRLTAPGTNLGIGTTTPQALLHLHRSNVIDLCLGIPTKEDTTASKAAIKLFKITTHIATNGFEASYDNANLSFKQQDKGNFSIEGPGGGLMIAPDGSIGVGTSTPRQKLHIVDGNILISKTSTKAPGSVNGSILFGADITSTYPHGKWGIEYLNTANDGYGLNFWIPYNSAGGPVNYILFLADDGKVGIGKKDPKAKLDIAGNLSVKESAFNLSIGNAYSTNLSNGTSYIGFNATRNNSTGNWTLEGYGNKNGGGVIWTTVDGTINFATVASTNGSNKTLTDTQIKSNINLQLTSAGILRAKEVVVTLTGWPDYVFNPNYELLPLNKVEEFIVENKHLPNVPSEAEVIANGVNIGEMNAILLQKVEELTLYIIDLQKQINELKTDKP